MLYRSACFAVVIIFHCIDGYSVVSYLGW